MILLQISSVSARDVHCEQVTLKDAIAFARSNHPLVKEAALRVTEAQQGITVARSHFLPRLNLNEIYMRTNDPVAVFGMNMWQQRKLGFTDLFSDFMDGFSTTQATGNDAVLNQVINGADERFYNVDDRGDFHTQVQLLQPVYNGGKEILGNQLARIHVDLVKKQKERVAEIVTFHVIEAYLRIFLAHSFVNVAEKARDSSEIHVKSAKSMADSGMVVESDLLRAQVHQATVIEMHITSKNQLELAEFGLKRAMGIDPSETGRYKANIAYFKTLDIKMPDAPEPDLIDDALFRRADLHSLQKGIDALRKMEQLAKTDYLPHLNAWFNYNLHNDDQFEDSGDNWAGGASLKLNLFDGLSTSGKVKQAKTRTAAMAQKAADLKQQIVLEVQNAYRNFNTALARIEVTQKAIESAKETLRIVSTRYTSGLIPIIHVTDAEVAFIQTETNYIKALHDAHLASAQIDLAVGRIDNDDG